VHRVVVFAWRCRESVAPPATGDASANNRRRGHSREVRVRCTRPERSSNNRYTEHREKVGGQRQCRVCQVQTTNHVPTSYNPDSAHVRLGVHARPYPRHQSATTDPAPQYARGALVAENPGPNSVFLDVFHPILTSSLFPTTTFPFWRLSPAWTPPRAVATGLTPVVSLLRPLGGCVTSRLVAAASRTRVPFRVSSPLPLCTRVHRRPPRSLSRAVSRLTHVSVVEVAHPRAYHPRGPTPSSWLTCTPTAREFSSRTLPCGGNPLSGVTRPPGMSRGRVVNSHATPSYGGSVGPPPWGGVQGASGPHMKRPL